MTIAKRVLPNVFHFDLLLSDRADLVEQICISTSGFKLLSVYTENKHRFRVGHRKIFGVKFQETHAFRSPLYLGKMERAKKTSNGCVEEGDYIHINDENSRLFSHFKLSRPRFSGMVTSVQDDSIFVSKNGTTHCFRFRRDAVSINGLYTSETSLNLTRTCEKLFSNHVGYSFQTICHHLAERGILSFNRLRFGHSCVDEETVVLTLIEAVFMLKRDIAHFFKNINFTPKAMFQIWRI